MLFYDFVRSRQHVRRNRQADLLGCFKIDDELELGWLFYRQFSGLGAFQDFVRQTAIRLMDSFRTAPYDISPPLTRKDSRG